MRQSVRELKDGFMSMAYMGIFMYVIASAYLYEADAISDGQMLVRIILLFFLLLLG